MPSQWNHKADKDLLLSIIERGALKGNEWPKIAEKMAAKGYTFTHEGCRQHFQKIRKESRPGSSPNPNSTASTPQKRTAGSAKKGGTPSKVKSFSSTPSFNTTPTTKGMKFEYDEEAGESDNEGFNTPLGKRAKIMKQEGGDVLQAAPMFKVEHLDAEGYNGGRASGVIILDHDDLYDEEG